MLVSRAAAEGLPPNPHGHDLANVSIIMCTIAGFFVTCRMLTRVLIHRLMGWDDYTLIFALCIAIGMTVCFNMQVYYGIGLHTYQVTNEHYKTMAFTWLWAAQLLYKFANGITKISILLLYMRLFPLRQFKIVSWVVIAYVVAYCAAAIFTSIFQCDPIRKAWIKSLPGQCLDIGKLWYSNSAFTILADVILIILPLKQIIQLQLPTAQKLGLVIVFSLGIFVMACTIIRCIDLGPTTSEKDSMYYEAYSNSWTFLEVDVSIICASLPLLKAPLKLLFPKIFGDRSTSRPAHGSPKSNSNGFGMSDWRRSHSRLGSSFARRGTADIESDEETMVQEAGIKKTIEVTLDRYERGQFDTIGRAF